MTGQPAPQHFTQGLKITMMFHAGDMSKPRIKTGIVRKQYSDQAVLDFELGYFIKSTARN